MTRRSRIAPLVILTSTIALASLAARTRALQDTPPAFRARVDAVRVDALVTRDARPLAGLTPADFELLDNGVRQSVTYLGVEAVPVNVLLMLDVSQSVAGDRLRSLAAAGRAVVDALRPIDRAAILSFSNAIVERVPLTADRQRLETELDRLSAGGTTSLYDAACAGLLLADSRQARTLLLIFSDGQDSSSWLAPSVVLDTAARSDAVAYAVTTDRADPRWLDRVLADPRRQVSGEWILRSQPSGFLDRLADATAGRVLHAEDRHLAGTFAGIVREFQNRYLLMYVPSGTDERGWHELTVRVRKARATVRARRGYWR